MDQRHARCASSTVTTDHRTPTATNGRMNGRIGRKIRASMWNASAANGGTAAANSTPSRHSQPGVFVRASTPGNTSRIRSPGRSSGSAYFSKRTAFSTMRTGIGLGLVTPPIAMVRLWPILALGVKCPQASVRYNTYGVAPATNRRAAPLAQGSSWPSVRCRFTTRTITAAMSPTRYAAPSGRTR